MQGDALERSHLEEGEGAMRVDEGNEALQTSKEVSGRQGTARKAKRTMCLSGM